jgi:hypothetical protein
VYNGVKKEEYRAQRIESVAFLRLVVDCVSPDSKRSRTVQYTVIDDFESYDGDVNQVGDTWIDGFTYPYNGSIIHLQVGLPVHTGGQSMLYTYDNTVKWDYMHYWSEVERTFSDPCDWAPLKVLTLWFYGGSGNDANDTEQMYFDG